MAPVLGGFVSAHLWHFGYTPSLCQTFQGALERMT